MKNLNNDSQSDYLRFALADEIANVLTYTRSLDVRPLAASEKYANGPADPQRAGREMKVGTIVTGHFMKQGDHLMVTLEAIDVNTNRLLWQTNLSSGSQDLISLQNALAGQLRRACCPS